MTRENKLALIIGFSLILVVAILITDHLSPAQNDEVADFNRHASVGTGNGALPIPTALPRQESPAERLASPASGESRAEPANEREPRRIINLQPAREAAETDVIDMGQPIDEAGTQVAPNDDRQWPLHYVVKNDTLYGIAQKYYGDPSLARKLAEFNSDRVMDGMNIRIGVAIRIPDRRVLTGDASAANPSAIDGSSPTPPSAGPAPTYREYRIQKGDTLGEISLKLLGTSKRWRELYELNKDVIDDPDNVIVGRVLRYPVE